MATMITRDRKLLMVQCAMAALGFGLAAMATCAFAEQPRAAELADTGLDAGTPVLVAEARRSQWLRSGGDDDQSWSISATREKSARRSEGVQLMPVNRQASWAIDAHYDRQVGTLGALGLYGDLRMDRRFPIGALNTGRALASRSIAAGVEWRGETGERVAVGIYDNRSMGSRSGVDRALEITAGAPLTGRGMAISVQQPLWVSAAGDGRATFVGVEARAGQASVSDGLAIGSTGQGRDARVMVSLTHRF